MTQIDNSDGREERHVIAKGDLAAVKALLDRGVINEKMASVMAVKVTEKEQIITIYIGGKYRIID